MFVILLFFFDFQISLLIFKKFFIILIVLKKAISFFNILHLLLLINKFIKTPVTTDYKNREYAILLSNELFGYDRLLYDKFLYSEL